MESPFQFILAFLLICSLIRVCFLGITTEAQTTNNGTLPQAEIDALKAIAEELHKTDWNFSLNPCDGNLNWNISKRSDMPQYCNSIICNCTFPNGVCHVEQLYLRGQDLNGVLPPSLAKLPYFKTIDLSRNYLSGTIPPQWATMKLEHLSAGVNCLSGPIPAYLGDITTLVHIGLESNMFNGRVPAELGKLENLADLNLAANNLTGALPTELNNLTNLQQLRLSSNNFTGSLPSFQNWPHLQALELKATGFQGPIPPNISFLKNLTELRVTDLNGDSSFPNVGDMINMSDLVLRNCNISGRIPGFIANMSNLKNLDLSFNNLVEGIPDFSDLQLMETMYLTGNALTGPIPDWIKNLEVKYQIDLSYNNFSQDSEPSDCHETLNLYRCCDDGRRVDQTKCLSVQFPCTREYYALHVNCGGNRTSVGNKIFEANQATGGAAKFSPIAENWGTSSTGNFWFVSPSVYVANNVSVIRGIDSELYTTAQLSPLSLTYYGRCLAKGNYTVTLYFAEIILRDNRSYQSLGRRMFDVYIQGERRLKDFDIEREAQGADKPLQIQYPRVRVDNGILEIRFGYAGKGSTAVPKRGTYGPLISAISVESEFSPPSKGKKKIYIAVGTSVGALVIILTSLGIIWRRRSARNKISREIDLKGLDLRTGKFTYRQILAATENFSAVNKIGEGGFGVVYKGTMLDGTPIAVKQLSQKSKQGNREFVNEIGIITGLVHPNVVRLYGCCIEGNQLFLVYEYMENNNLARALFGPEELQLDLDWPTRHRICVGISKGLAFLHDESALKIVHRDIKANNILLDRELNPKISDFGLAKLDEENTHISTRVAGTIGYMAPEYALWGYLTFKADVYSFGIVALEIVAGKNNMAHRPSEDFVCLLDWALVLQKRGSLLELVDPKLGSNFNEEEALRMIKVVIMCTNPSPALRPTMSSVVSLLEGHINDDYLQSDPSVYNDGLKLQGLRDKYSSMQMQSPSTETQTAFTSSEKESTSLSSTRSC